MLGAFTSGLASGGVAQTSLTIKGPLASPEVIGKIDVKSGELRLETPSLSATDFNGTIAVDASRTGTIDLTGLVNGGPTDVRGTFTLENFTSPDGRVSLDARNVVLEYPDGFQTESNAHLDADAVSRPARRSPGRIDVLSGIYREPLMVSRRLLAGLTEDRVVPPVDTESSFLTNLRLDVTVATHEEIRHRQQLWSPEPARPICASTGTADRPGCGRTARSRAGRRDLPRRQHLSHPDLIVDLTNPLAIAPYLTFLAETRVRQRAD